MCSYDRIIDYPDVFFAGCLAWKLNDWVASLRRAIAMGTPISASEKLLANYLRHTLEIAIAMEEAERAVTLYSILSGSTSTVSLTSWDFSSLLKEMRFSLKH